jgi:hypothetical protein
MKQAEENFNLLLSGGYALHYGYKRMGISTLVGSKLFEDVDIHTPVLRLHLKRTRPARIWMITPAQLANADWQSGTIHLMAISHDRADVKPKKESPLSIRVSAYEDMSTPIEDICWSCGSMHYHDSSAPGEAEKLVCGECHTPWPRYEREFEEA